MENEGDGKWDCVPHDLIIQVKRLHLLLNLCEAPDERLDIIARACHYFYMLYPKMEQGKSLLQTP
uniref:Uncharacterized protein n=1 Tax=Thermosporothrix sp. COM3 TaxID=2490863 RepID=A0A455SHS2_9CHLR|nr:hypothetical protein KTC_12200 [Thermosporothrix sp. COM3]